jgi:predicted esterase
MKGITHVVLLTAALFGAALIVLPGPLAAQGKGGEPVKITTIDGVELHGMFYAGAKPKAPTVIVLHAIGDSAVNKKLYTSLAESLQPNYSVMLFDFRGHGKSKEVNPQEFWKFPGNQQGIKGGNPKKTTIEQGDFDKAKYYPVLVNDIAAVKAYLDRRNDSNDCNTSSTILIGAESGATLGAAWLNSQWHLIRMIPNANPLLPPQPSPTSEGKNVVASIWLSPTSKFGGPSPISLSRPLDVPVRTNGCATVFMHGDKDTTGKTLCDALVTKLKVKDDPKHKFITAYEVKGGGKLQGINLLQKSLNVDEVINQYLGDVLEKRANEWTKRDFEKTQYMWKMGGGFTPAKTPLDMNNLSYDTYQKFLGN